MSQTHPQENPAVVPQKSFLKQRLHSLDAYRGLIMVSLAFAGFGLAATAANHLEHTPQSAFWQTVRFQFEHVDWVGCAYWDLIQPSFMFMVGAAMAFSYAKRRELGHSYGQMFRHAFSRSLILICLGMFLSSNGQSSTSWTFMNVLAQIGLGYTFLFLLWARPFRVQALTAAAILVGVWLAYVSYPYSGINLETGNPELGISKEWAQEHLAGVPAPWHKSANVGRAVDVCLLNLLPRETPYVFNRGGYQTINFIPSLVTMLFGLMCGELLRSDRRASRKLLILVTAGTAGIVAGLLLQATGVCPLIKRIWTPAWTLYSAGWCCLIMASLYGVVDMLDSRWWTFPLMVVGVNSIAVYCMSQMLKPWTGRTLRTHLGQDIFNLAGAIYEPTVRAVMVGTVFWLICWWMYRQKIFIRI